MRSPFPACTALPQTRACEKSHRLSASSRACGAIHGAADWSWKRRRSAFITEPKNCVFQPFRQPRIENKGPGNQSVESAQLSVPHPPAADNESCKSRRAADAPRAGRGRDFHGKGEHTAKPGALRTVFTRELLDAEPAHVETNSDIRAKSAASRVTLFEIAFKISQESRGHAL